MVNYSEIYERVDNFLQTRKGLNNPKKKQDYIVFVGELTGIFCRIAHLNNLDTNSVIEYLDLVQQHKIVNVIDDGKPHNVSDLIDSKITNHPLYYLTEFALMYYKPGRVQVGPGEFFMCFYDCDSVFGIDNQNGFDVVLDDTTTEMKKVGSNHTSPELFDKYAKSGKVDRLLGVKPVSNAKKPQASKRSKYVCVTFSKMDWREAFTHVAKAGTLALVNN